MIANINSIVETLEKDEKIIQYLKGIYKEKTGEEAIIPPDSELFKTEEEEEKETIPNQKFATFKDKVNSLQLPDPNDRGIQNKIEKLRKKNDTKILKKKLDLSYFSNKEFSMDLLKKVIEGMKIIKTVEFINLSHNDLNDTYIDSILEILLIPNMKRIDISYNKFTINILKKLIAHLKKYKNIEYFDISYNPICNSESACNQICTSLKQHQNLEHFGINDCSRESAIRLVGNHPLLCSLNLEDSRYKKKSWDTLGKFISNKKYCIKRLSLKFCKIELQYAGNSLSNALSKNKTIEYLNLYNTGMDDITGSLIINNIYNHPTLTELDMGNNKLGIHFCKSLGKVLKLNKVLKKINISKNEKILNDSFQYIIQGLIDNQTLESLGNLVESEIGVKYRESAEKLLNLNKKFETWQETGNVKNEKIDFFMSSVGFDIIQKEKEEKERKEKEEKERKEKEEKEKKEKGEEDILDRFLWILMDFCILI